MGRPISGDIVLDREILSARGLIEATGAHESHADIVENFGNSPLGARIRSGINAQCRTEVLRELLPICPCRD